MAVQETLTHRLAQVEMHEEPFPWPEWKQLVPREVAQQLVDEIPLEGFEAIERSDGDKTYQMQCRNLVSNGVPAVDDLTSLWRDVIEMLVSTSYSEALSGAIGISLEDLAVDITLWRYPAEGFLSPHPDHQDKVFSQLIYLNPIWLEEWGGCLRLVGESPVVVTPDLGRSVGIIRTDRSIHEVTRVVSSDAPGRMSLQVVFSKRP